MSINQKKKIICIISGSEVRYIDAKTKTVILIQHLVDGKLKGIVSGAQSNNPVETQLPVIYCRNNGGDLVDVFVFYQYSFTVELMDRRYPAVWDPILNEYICNICDVQEHIELTLWVMQ